MNSRLDELQAAILSARLDWLDEGNERRRQLAAFYRAALKGVTLPVEARVRATVPPIRSAAESARYSARLPSMASGPLVHYRPGAPAAGLAHLAGRCRAVSERLCEQIVSLPLYPELTDDEAEQVVAAVNAA